MSLHMNSVSTEQAAEKLLATVREYDRNAYLYHADEGEFGFWTVCYYWPLREKRNEADKKTTV